MEAVKTFVIRTSGNAAQLHAYLKANARAMAEAGTPLLAKFVPLKNPKSRIQESRYHAMILDISKQCTVFARTLNAECFKRLLIDQFVSDERKDAQATGKTDPFPQFAALSPSLDGERIVQLGAQSRSFTQEQASNFIEYLFSYGAENGVQWTNNQKEEQH